LVGWAEVLRHILKTDAGVSNDRTSANELKRGVSATHGALPHRTIERPIR
jgi:hypothetical protein